MKLRIDTTGVTFFCTRAPEPRLAHDTGAPKIDKETGKPLWQTQIMALDSSGGEVITVTVAGEPKAGVGEPVKVEGLTALPWSQGDRSGVAFRAAALRSTGAPIGGVIAPSTSGNAGGAGAAKPAA